MTVDLLAKDRDLLIRLLKEKESSLSRAVLSLESYGEERFAGFIEDHRSAIAKLANIRTGLEATKRKR